jgi:hypothetical protein
LPAAVSPPENTRPHPFLPRAPLGATTAENCVKSRSGQVKCHSFSPTEPAPGHNALFREQSFIVKKNNQIIVFDIKIRLDGIVQKSWRFFCFTGVQPDTVNISSAYPLNE